MIVPRVTPARPEIFWAFSDRDEVKAPVCDEERDDGASVWVPRCDERSSRLTEFRSSSNHEMSDRRIARKLSERSFPVKASEAARSRKEKRTVSEWKPRAPEHGRTNFE